MIIAVLKETYPGERRVALAPTGLASLAKAGHEILIESGAGAAAGFRDSDYQDGGAKIIDRRDALFAQGEIVLQVRGYGSNPEAGRADLKLMRAGQIFVGFMEPLGEPGLMEELAKTGAQCYSMELIPRITRAQSMDALSSMATLAGYKAVLLAAEALPKIFPMMMTAAGNLAPAKVFVIGVGVAGLQAIATARRLGAVVVAYDVRPAVKEQVESVGARFVELDLDTGQSEGEGGYAKAEGEEFYRRQRAMMLKVVAENDVVITTAAIPGRKAPILVTEEMVMAMTAGSVIVDLAAERGGNCELTQPDRTVVQHGVTIIGLENLPSTIPQHASQMYSKNISTLLLHLIEEDLLGGQTEDEIARECLITRDGKVVHPRINALLDEAAKS